LASNPSYIDIFHVRLNNLKSNGDEETLEESDY